MFLRFTHLTCLSMYPVLLCRAFLCADPARSFWQGIIQLAHQCYLIKVSKKATNWLRSLDTDFLHLGHQRPARTTAERQQELASGWRIGRQILMYSAGQVIVEVHAQERGCPKSAWRTKEGRQKHVLPQAQGTTKQPELPGEMQTTYINLEARPDT